MKMIKNLVFVSILFLVAACSQTKENHFRKLALQGKQVFEDHNCGSCHNITGSQSDSLAPDLTNPIIANDSLLVQTHLKFIKESDMPAQSLTPKEIRLVSYYIAGLYNSTLPPIPKNEIDAYDAVCFAPVSKEKAKSANLYVRYLGTEYYFASQRTMDTFKDAPEAYAMLYKKYQQDKKELN